MKQIILIAILTTLITACSRYQPTILQGNALDSATIAQIKVGMSKADVIQILGSSLMQDDFQTKRWDYLYYSVEQGRKSEQKNLTLEFNGDVVSKIN